MNDILPRPQCQAVPPSSATLTIPATSVPMMSGKKGPGGGGEKEGRNPPPGPGRERGRGRGLRSLLSRRAEPWNCWRSAANAQGRRRKLRLHRMDSTATGWAAGVWMEHAAATGRGRIGSRGKGATVQWSSGPSGAPAAPAKSPDETPCATFALSFAAKPPCRIRPYLDGVRDGTEFYPDPG